MNVSQTKLHQFDLQRRCAKKSKNADFANQQKVVRLAAAWCKNLLMDLLNTLLYDKSTNAQNPLHTFPRNFRVHGKAANFLRTCCGLVSDTDNKSASSRCNGIWETTRHNRHDGLLPAPTCYLSFTLQFSYRLVVDLLRGSRQLITGLLYGETGVMDFGSYSQSN